MRVDWCSYKRGQRVISSLPPCEDTLRRQPFVYLGLGFSSLQNCEKVLPSVIHPIHRIFFVVVVMAA